MNGRGDRPGRLPDSATSALGGLGLRTAIVVAIVTMGAAALLLGIGGG